MEIKKWRQCSSCKKDIGFDQVHYVCSVSTCNQKRTGLVFCGVPCWERHLPVARHRDASAYQERSPRVSEFERSNVGSQDSTSTDLGGGRRIIPKSHSVSAPTRSSAEEEILVVVSKVKDYIRLRSEMNTSGNIMPLLSESVRRLCDAAIDKARADGRKTVLDRDFE